MAISRRNALKSLGVAAAAPLLDSRRFRRQAEGLDPTLLAAIAEVVLPTEGDRTAAVAAFTAWIANYKEGADTDHGYGNTRVRATGPSPARNYAAQIAARDAAAQAKGAAGFAAAGLEQRRAIVEAAIVEAKIERLPARPAGAHIAADLMGHYFGSAAAQDLCYRAAIGRDACRGLAGSEKKPADLPRKADLPPKGGSYGVG
jgi:Gluconate 2-dehydrogenase subunit 3